MKDRVGKWLMRWRIRAVLPHVRGRLLDIGCGTNQLVRACGNGIGVDVYPWEGADLVVEDTTRLPFPDDSFDTVSIVAALNHIPNREEVLREANRVLRPGGRILVTMIPPWISAVWHWLRRPWDHDQSERGMQDGELYGLTSRQVRRLFDEAGFRMQRQRRFMLGINCLSVGRKTATGGGPDDQRKRKTDASSHRRSSARRMLHRLRHTPLLLLVLIALSRCPLAARWALPLVLIASACFLLTRIPRLTARMVYPLFVAGAVACAVLSLQGMKRAHDANRYRLALCTSNGFAELLNHPGNESVRAARLFYVRLAEVLAHRVLVMQGDIALDTTRLRYYSHLAECRLGQYQSAISVEAADQFRLLPHVRLNMEYEKRAVYVLDSGAPAAEPYYVFRCLGSYYFVPENIARKQGALSRNGVLLAQGPRDNQT